MSSAYTLEMSSLARFDNAGLVSTLRRRRTWVRELKDQGLDASDSLFRARLMAVRAVVETLEARGATVPEYAA